MNQILVISFLLKIKGLTCDVIKWKQQRKKTNIKIKDREKIFIFIHKYI